MPLIILILLCLLLGICLFVGNFIFSRIKEKYAKKQSISCAKTNILNYRITRYFMKRKSWGIIASLGIIVFVWTFIVGHTNPSVTNSKESWGVHGTVDLGLSVEWADCNIGANKPYETGWYFRWGETNSYNQSSNYQIFENSIPYHLTETEDAAASLWSNGWRMPTLEELQELVSKCKWEWIDHFFYKGYIVTGPNGNSIFLPTTGFQSGNQVEYSSNGYYWTSDLNFEDSSYAMALQLSKETYYFPMNISRNYGRAIRPVHGTSRNMCDIPIENNTENDLEKRNQNKSYFKQDEDQQTDTHPVTNIHRKSQLVMQGTDPVDHSFDNKVSDKASNQWQRPAANQVQTQGYKFFFTKDYSRGMSLEIKYNPNVDCMIATLHEDRFKEYSVENMALTGESDDVWVFSNINLMDYIFQSKINENPGYTMFIAKDWSWIMVSPYTDDIYTKQVSERKFNELTLTVTSYNIKSPTQVQTANSQQSAAQMKIISERYREILRAGRADRDSRHRTRTETAESASSSHSSSVSVKEYAPDYTGGKFTYWCDECQCWGPNHYHKILK